jgi:hypothetical protein
VGLDVAIEALRDCLHTRRAAVDELWHYATIAAYRTSCGPISRRCCEAADTAAKSRCIGHGARSPEKRKRALALTRYAIERLLFGLAILSILESGRSLDRALNSRGDFFGTASCWHRLIARIVTLVHILEPRTDGAKTASGKPPSGLVHL